MSGGPGPEPRQRVEQAASAAQIACRDLVELTTEWLEGVLDTRTEHLLARHIALCEGCEAHVQQVETTLAVVRASRAEARDGSISAQRRAAILAAFRQGIG